MRFVSRLVEREIIMFYKSLHNEKLVSSREKRDFTGVLVANFEIKKGWKKHRIYKKVGFKDFEIEVEFVSKRNPLIEKYSVSECNALWRKFLSEKFGKEYDEALNEFLGSVSRG